MGPGKESAERMLAHITIDGRKERICKFSSGTNVWTRWRCRRCFSNVPAGLQGKHKKTFFFFLIRIKGGTGDHPPVVKKGSLVIKKKSVRGCVQRWTYSASSKDGAKGPTRMESRRDGEVVWKRIARWRLRRKRTARKSWMSERCTHRDSCETLNSLRT